MMRDSNSDIQVREIEVGDLEDMYRYFFESPPEFLRSIGLKPRQPGDDEIFRQRWAEQFAERKSGGQPIPVLTVLFRGERIGFHTTTHREPGKSLIMHAHFFRSDLRGKGIGTVSYVLALDKFLTEYGYKEVIFKTPKRNLAPMKIKEKLGLEPIGEEVIDWPQLIEPLAVKVFRVLESDLPGLKTRVGL